MFTIKKLAAVFVTVALCALSGGLVSCASLPPAETTSLTVSLGDNVSEETAAELFQVSALRLFRRYNPQAPAPNVVTAQYGSYPVTLWYEDKKIYITSSCPHKHAGWMVDIRHQMNTLGAD